MVLSKECFVSLKIGFQVVMHLAEVRKNGFSERGIVVDDFAPKVVPSSHRQQRMAIARAESQQQHEMAILLGGKNSYHFLDGLPLRGDNVVWRCVTSKSANLPGKFSRIQSSTLKKPSIPRRAQFSQTMISKIRANILRLLKVDRTKCPFHLLTKGLLVRAPQPLKQRFPRQRKFKHVPRGIRCPLQGLAQASALVGETFFEEPGDIIAGIAQPDRV